MIDQGALEALLKRTLKSVEGLAPSSSGWLRARGGVVLEDRPLIVRIELDPSFTELPHLYLETPLEQRIPHVTDQGLVCYSTRSGYMIDHERHELVVLDAVGRSLSLLQRGLSGSNDEEFLAEFVPHWIAVGGVDHWVRCAVEPSHGVRPIRAAYILEKDGKRTLHWLADRQDQLERLATIGELVSVEYGDAIYVRLEGAVRVPPGRPGTRWDVITLRDFGLNHLTPKLQRYLMRLRQEHPLVPTLLAIPRAGDTVALVGFEPLDEDHDPFNAQATFLPRFFMTERYDQAFLLPRGGASTKLRNKRVLVIGCGSVGARVAEYLAAGGVGALTLVDHDLYASANLQRHILSHWCVGLRKATALQLLLKGRFPHVKVESVPTTIATALREAKVRFEAFDLVVCATGEVEVERALNRDLFKRRAPPAVYAWLEPLGIGGHALLVVNNRLGCLECLYDQEELPHRLQAQGLQSIIHNRAGFAAGQAWQTKAFTRDLDGCGGAFTAFSALDAARTAEVACRLSLRALEGSIRSPKLVSWRGDASAFLSQGYVLSERYRRFGQSLIEENPQVYARSDCPCCGMA